MALVVDEASESNSSLFYLAVDAIIRQSAAREDGAVRVAFDCEGINLSRLGSIEIVSICFGQVEEITIAESRNVFLVDVGKKKHESKSSGHEDRVAAIKRLFECSTVVKVIHDCRMDSDALYHHLGVKLVNVHDTSCFHRVITGEGFKNLNYVLGYNGLPSNVVRDNDVYETNPAFWATRPLTGMMVDWASSDVDMLLTVATRQISNLETLGGRYLNEARTMSTEYTLVYRDLKASGGVHLYKSIGLFIGRKGANIQALCRETGTHIFQDRSNQGKWIIYYADQTALDSVLRAMGH